MVHRADALSDDAARRALELLDQTQREILAELARLPADSFSAAHLRMVRSIVDAHINELIARYQREMPGLLTQAEEMGYSLVDMPLQAAGVPVTTLGIAGSNLNLISVLSQYSADLITALGDEARKRINAVLARSALGTVTPHEAIQQIAGTLPGPATFTTVAARAETIFRTEIGRVTSITGQVRIGQMADRLPGLEKEWIAVDDARTRPEHFTVAGYFTDSGQPTVVDAKGFYIVGNEQARFPRDPMLSVGNSAGCRCHSVPHVNDAVMRGLGVTVAA
jgi:hypothetical protein